MAWIASIGLAAGVAMAACVGGIDPDAARGDGSIDAAERTRSAFGTVWATDRSYDAVEQTRARHSAPADDSYEQAERTRAEALDW